MTNQAKKSLPHFFWSGAKKKKKKEKEYPQDGLKVSQSSLLAFNAHFKIYRGLLPAFHFYFYLH